MHQVTEKTLSLNFLSACIESCSNYNYKYVTFSTLTKCDLCFYDVSITSRMDNICFKLIDGHKWKQIIDGYLPKLQTFPLRTNDSNVFSEHNTQVKVNDLIDPFQSLFWIDEHRWFVRCFTEDKTIHLDTLSNSSSYYDDDIFPDT